VRSKLYVSRETALELTGDVFDENQLP